MTNLISARNLFWRPTVNYQTDILRNINIDLNESDIIILKGLAGSGKTVLLKSLSLKIPVSSGTINYFDKDFNEISKAEIKEIKKKIVYIDDTTSFIKERSIYQNLEFILSLNSTPEEIVFNRIMHVLKLTGLMPKRDVSPAVLSTNEKRLFAIAVALVREVSIILCDFNITGLDEDEDILRLLKNLALRGTGIIVSSKLSGKSGNVKVVTIKNGEIK